MLRVINENKLGANHTETAHEQKQLLEGFCNECLQQNNVRAMAGEGPLIYKEAKGDVRGCMARHSVGNRKGE